MEEIKVGDYIRTIDGYIRLIDNIYTDKKEITYRSKYILDIPYKYSQGISAKKIKSHSPNLIDLIEEGDYVNGSKAIDIVQAPVKAIYTEDIEQKLALIPIVNEQIKSVVTKEQFSQVKYEV